MAVIGLATGLKVKSCLVHINSMSVVINKTAHQITQNLIFILEILQIFSVFKTFSRLGCLTAAQIRNTYD